MTTKDGQEREFTLDEDGTLARVEMGVGETPPAVQKTVAAQVGAGKLESIAKVIDDDGITYEAEMTTADGKEREFTVGPEGRLLSIEVALEELSAEVQKTIKEQVGAGKIEWIDKSFEMKKKVQPYEIEATKDGKPFNFSVGPKGRFLGIDE
jgi:VIT1/CCC1 family predicted Fe2+/Mn2+ transporter